MSAYHHHLVIRSKLAAPRLHRRTLPRPRINARLIEAADYRLTLVQAGAGYGKSTALATFVSSAPFPSVWYHLDREDVDPLRFLLHLWHGFSQALDGFSAAPLALLEEMAEAPRSTAGDPGRAQERQSRRPSGTQSSMQWAMRWPKWTHRPSPLSWMTRTC